MTSHTIRTQRHCSWNTRPLHNSKCSSAFNPFKSLKPPQMLLLLPSRFTVGMTTPENPQESSGPRSNEIRCVRKLLFVTCDTPPPVWPSASCVCCVQKNQLCDHPLAAAHFLAVTNFWCTNLGYGVSFRIIVTGEQMGRGGGQAGSAAESRARFLMAQLKTASQQVPQSKFPPIETQ